MLSSATQGVDVFIFFLFCLYITLTSIIKNRIESEITEYDKEILSMHASSLLGLFVIVTVWTERHVLLMFITSFSDYMEDFF